MREENNKNVFDMYKGNLLISGEDNKTRSNVIEKLLLDTSLMPVNIIELDGDLLQNIAKRNATVINVISYVTKIQDAIHVLDRALFCGDRYTPDKDDLHIRRIFFIKGLDRVVEDQLEAAGVSIQDILHAAKVRNIPIVIITNESNNALVRLLKSYSFVMYKVMPDDVAEEGDGIDCSDPQTELHLLRRSIVKHLHGTIRKGEPLTIVPGVGLVNNEEYPIAIPLKTNLIITGDKGTGKIDMLGYIIRMLDYTYTEKDIEIDVLNFGHKSMRDALGATALPSVDTYIDNRSSIPSYLKAVMEILVERLADTVEYNYRNRKALVIAVQGVECSDALNNKVLMKMLKVIQDNSETTNIHVILVTSTTTKDVVELASDADTVVITTSNEKEIYSAEVWGPDRAGVPFRPINIF